MGFQQMGYRFTPTFIQNILAKYDSRTRRLTLDNFIVVCVQIKRLTDSFRSRDREMRGQAMMQYEDFIGLALGAHSEKNGQLHSTLFITFVQCANTISTSTWFITS